MTITMNYYSLLASATQDGLAATMMRRAEIAETFAAGVAHELEIEGHNFPDEASRSLVAMARRLFYESIESIRRQKCVLPPPPVSSM